MVCDGTYRHNFLITSGPDNISCLFNEMLEDEKMAESTNPITLPRLKKIAGQIFLSTKGAMRMSGLSSP
jgi:hypothetical protein